MAITDKQVKHIRYKGSSGDRIVNYLNIGKNAYDSITAELVDESGNPVTYYFGFDPTEQKWYGQSVAPTNSNDVHDITDWRKVVGFVEFRGGMIINTIRREEFDKLQNDFNEHVASGHLRCEMDSTENEKLNFIMGAWEVNEN